MNGLRKIIRRAKLRRHTVMARRFVQKRKVVEHEVNEVDYKVDYQPGEPAEFGYNETHKFPKEWVPWRNVLNMDFSLLGVAGFLWLMYFMYERTYLEESGRTARDQTRKYYKS